MHLNTYDKSNTCKLCNNTCLTCFGPKSNECLTCDFTNELRGEFLFSTKECIAKCPSKTYEESNICKNCDDACLTCDGPIENNCLSCNAETPVKGNYNLVDKTGIDFCPIGMAR